MDDVPGTYSLVARSREEAVARDIICFSEADVVVVVCDATCLSRNLNLVLQIMEVTPRVVLCVNLMDEAKKKGIDVDIKLLEQRLCIPVVATAARKGKGLEELQKKLELVAFEKDIKVNLPVPKYPEELEKAAHNLAKENNCSFWIALKLIEGDEGTLNAFKEHLSIDVESISVKESLKQAKEFLEGMDVSREISTAISRQTDKILDGVVNGKQGYSERDRKWDHILTGKITGPICMLLLLGIVFWITIIGANKPSEWLSKFLFEMLGQIEKLMIIVGAPSFLIGVIVDGALRVLFWVISVMLPPMAIFFPMFTLLEDLGYLPRIAFNMDRHFQKCHACGKQCLTMCMGFGCNAVGVTGCRIIDSPRERLIAVLTNCFVPCNGRFPLLIALISAFVAHNSVATAAVLLGVILLGVTMTLIASAVLSNTLLKGVPTHFMLELPPFRRPQILKVIVRSLLDRTLFVLGRAIVVAAPAGIVIWMLANISIGDNSILAICSGFLDPIGKLLGMDGVILMAFILGWPANEIVIPIILMSYLCSGTLTEYASLAELHSLLVANGWTVTTAICTVLFSLMHWPCSTTCLTIKKETGSLKWTAISVILPTMCGMICCFLVSMFSKML